MPKYPVKVFVERLTIVENDDHPYALCGPGYKAGDVFYRAMIMWTCYQVCFHGPLLSDVIGKAEEYIYETDCDSYAVVTYSRAMSATDAG